ncbi:hypothetical protein PG614_10000 [Riemerella anatipestifer]|nr:hypothetical protein [Riemerella anatipestifer]MDY3534219.1 hypothetical protein [Riemerella anatipestifer]MDY3536278.1 hypothetical protein [Riemerella anatipestifer]
MQKVITVVVKGTIQSEKHFYIEHEYDELNSYLEEGYKVIQIVPISMQIEKNINFSITFLLEKN